MTELKIKYDELDWEDECVPYGAIYKKKKFTGIAIDEFDDGSYEKWRFYNGIVHGHTYFFDKKNNKIMREGFYQNGVPVSTHFSWISENKHTKTYHEGTLLMVKIEDKNKTLLFEYEREKMSLTEWFNNGNKRSEKLLISTDNLYQFKSEKFWNENGIWLMTINNDKLYEFNSSYLSEHSHDLNSEDEERIFILYAKQLLEEQYNIGVKYLQLNTTHKNPFFRYQCARLLSNTNNQESIIFLEKLLLDDLHPETKLSIDWHGHGSSKKTQYPISKMAQIAIENIKNSPKTD